MLKQLILGLVISGALLAITVGLSDALGLVGLRLFEGPSVQEA